MTATDDEIRAAAEVSDGCRWISPPFHSRERALDYIRRDIEAHRNLPIDEAAERLRLMPQFTSRDAALDYIRTDIEAHRYLPFDEEAERQRLMPV